jgi:hypothetical protein
VKETVLPSDERSIEGKGSFAALKDPPAARDKAAASFS